MNRRARFWSPAKLRVLVLTEAVHVIEGIVMNRVNRFVRRARALWQSTEHGHEEDETIISRPYLGP